MTLLDTIKQEKLIVIVRGVQGENLLALARALYDGGIRLMEITYDAKGETPDAGADFVKVFPATGLGAAYIKAVAAPLSHIPLLAVGGVNDKNIGEFLRAGACGFGVGGCLVDKTAINEGRFADITAAARTYVKAVKDAV